MQAEKPIPIKLVMIGDGSVGKTCILLSYTTDKFPTAYIPTVFDNYSAQVKFEGKLINLGLWDTAGQEEFNKLRPLSYPHSDIFVIVFSVTEPNSFENAIKKWLPELQENAPQAPKLFVGNKIDLRTDDSKTMIQYSIANKVITELGWTYCECSALSRDGLKQVFEQSIRDALNYKEKKQQQTGSMNKQSEKINRPIGKRADEEARQEKDSSCSLQ